MTNSEPTVLIIGAGTFGTSTAYHLAKKYRDPSRVTLLDRWGIESALKDKHAAAVDTNRIIRTDYESPLYCNLANEAIHFWFWSIAVQGHFHKSGWVVFDDKHAKFGDAVRKQFQDRGGDYTRDVEWDEMQKHDILAGAKSDDYGKGYFNPEAGWCDAEKATMSFAKEAFELGIQRRTGEVQELLYDELHSRIKGVRLRDGITLMADQVVLCAGAWTSALLAPLEDALKFSEEDCIERQITAVGRLSAYYPLSGQEAQRMIDEKTPTVVLGGQVDIIPPSQPNRTLRLNDIKTEIINTINTPSGRRISVPSRRDQNDVPQKLRSESLKVMSRAMPVWTSQRTPERWRICYDAVTPTEDWLMCRHPSQRLQNLYIAVGGSFHSYKFLPVAGNYMCNILEGKSNGEEKDTAWKWKDKEELQRKCGKEFGNSSRNMNRKELRSYEESVRESKL
ncbi:hypothetical protein ACN47E_000178 [Coniothyrium glycines]